MELGSKVTELEEEVAVLKGEIKTILQEVRTAVLARANPFAVDAYETLQIPAPVTEPAPKPTSLQPEPEAPTDIEPPSIAPADRPRLTAIPTPFPGRDETDVASPDKGQPINRRWSVGSLATLIAWTQETASRMDPSDMDIVLSLARYGGLIDEELEATLTKLSKPLFMQDQQPRPKGVSDYLLALRELSALIEEAEDTYRGSGPMRRAS